MPRAHEINPLLRMIALAAGMVTGVWTYARPSTQDTGADLVCPPPPLEPSSLYGSVFEACAGRTPGQVCRIRFEGASRKGHCVLGESERLLCVP